MNAAKNRANQAWQLQSQFMNPAYITEKRLSRYEIKQATWMQDGVTF